MAAIFLSRAALDRDKPVASASASSDKTRKTGMPGRTGHIESRSLCGRWKKYIFAKTRARDARGRRHARADGVAYQQKQKYPFQEKLSFQYLEGSMVCKAEKISSKKKAARTGDRSFFLADSKAQRAGVTERFRNTPFTEALAKFERYSAQEAESGLAPEVIGMAVWRA